MKGGERKAVRGSSSTRLIDSTGNETNDAAMISALGGARDKRKQLRKASRTDRRGKQVHGRVTEPQRQVLQKLRIRPGRPVFQYAGSIVY